MRSGWQAVGRMLPAIEADTPGPVRDRAIPLVLSVYGLQSGDVRHIRLIDIDWGGDWIRFRRSKSLRAAEARFSLRLARPSRHTYRGTTRRPGCGRCSSPYERRTGSSRQAGSTTL